MPPEFAMRKVALFSLFSAYCSLLISPFPCYIYCMTIEQIVEIPADHRIFLDLPRDLPVGKAKITITSQEQTHNTNINDVIVNIRGLTKKMGSTLSVEQFLKMRREDFDLEEAKYRRFFQEKE